MLPERDWRMLRAVHRAGLDRCCARVLEECTAAMQDTRNSPHDRYLRLFELVNDRHKRIAAAFGDVRRSTAIQRLASMIALGVVSETELDRFSPATRDAATALAALGR